jgi:hypothetical protein
VAFRAARTNADVERAAGNGTEARSLQFTLLSILHPLSALLNRPPNNIEGVVVFRPAVEHALHFCAADRSVEAFD